MITFDEALALVIEVARPLGSETVPLAQAAGRVLAQPQRARSDAPLSAVSTMDGYAVREADVASGPTRLSIVGRSYPGKPFPGRIGEGECARVFTGAALPQGADRVVIQEEVRCEGDVAVLDGAAKGARYVRAGGSDFKAGETVVEAGARLTPLALVGAAAADVAEVEAYVRPRVAILTNGDELAAPGEASEREGAVPDSVSIGLCAFVGAWGGEAVQTFRVKDDAEALTGAAEAALEAADVVVIAGGASVGERDLAKAAFEPSGLELVFSKVAIRPGKPVWLGRAKGRLVLGLPGNPTSALVTARLFLAPLLAGLGGADAQQAVRWEEARLSADLEATGERETFYRARRLDGGVSVLPNQDSGAQKTLALTDVLIRRFVRAPAAKAGETVLVLPA